MVKNPLPNHRSRMMNRNRESCRAKSCPSHCRTTPHKSTLQCMNEGRPMSHPSFALSFIPRWMRGVLGCQGFGQRKPQCLCHSFSIRGVGSVAVADMPLFDKEFRIAHRSSRILTGGSPVSIRHQSPQLIRLREVVAVEFALVVGIHLARSSQRRLFQRRLILPLAITIRLIRNRAPCIPIGAHLPITMIGMIGGSESPHSLAVIVGGGEAKSSVTYETQRPKSSVHACRIDKIGNTDNDAPE